MIIQPFVVREKGAGQPGRRSNVAAPKELFGVSKKQDSKQSNIKNQANSIPEIPRIDDQLKHDAAQLQQKQQQEQQSRW